MNKIPPQEQAIYSARREKLLAMLPQGSIAVLANAPVRQRNADCDYTYRPDSSFYYLTGFDEPGAVAVFYPGNAAGEYILFCRDADPVRDVWDGPSVNPDTAADLYASDAAFPISILDDFLQDNLAKVDSLYYPLHSQMHLDFRIQRVMRKIRLGIHRQIMQPKAIANLNVQLAALRMQKDAHEIALMQRAADISVLAHEHAMRVCKPGMSEWDIAVELQYVMAKQGSRALAYDTIAASGNNACTLHYTTLNSVMADGDLLLIDAGCEYSCYASDITRTIPVNGKFSAQQLDLYNAVLDVQQSAIDAISSKIKNLTEFQSFTVKAITEKLCDLKILSGNVEDLVAQKSYQQFYPHGVGHPLGMDVHDIQDLTQGPYELKPGCVITVEPGIYIPQSADVAEKWRGLGVRIEDDVHITESGPSVLTEKLVRSASEIEEIMRD